MKSHGLFRQTINLKNRSGCSRVDLQKRCAPQLEWRRGIPKWHDDVNVGYINSTHHITQIQLGLMGLVVVAAVASGGIGGDITAIADDHATGSHVFKDLCRDCDADTTTDVILLCDASDASPNAHLVEIGGSMVDSISQRLSLGWR